MRKILILILLSFPVISGAYNAAILDSVGSRVIEGRQYLVHQIEPKETWYSLNRKYHVSVKELQTTNSDVKVLLIGKTVLIPLSGNYFSTTRSNRAFSTPTPFANPVKESHKAQTMPPTNRVEPPTSVTTARVHVVQPGETMYRLSKMYGVSVADIQHWNNIPDYTISIGQSVIVTGPGSAIVKPTYAPAFSCKSIASKNVGNPKTANDRAIEIALDYIKNKPSLGEPGDMSVLDSMEKRAKSTIVNKNAVPLVFKDKPAVKPVATGSATITTTTSPNGTTVVKTNVTTTAKPSVGGRPNITIISKNKPNTPVVTEQTGNMPPVSVLETPAEKPKTAQTITVMQPAVRYSPPINKELPTSAPYTGQAALYKPPTPITTKIDNKKVEIPVKQTTELPKRDSNEVIAVPSQAKLPTTSGDKKVMKEQIEKGNAGWINDEDVNPNKYYALHKKAPIGTIIKVTNTANGQSIFVKVVGVLPETADNSSLMIKISKSAAKKLVVMEPKFQAELSYGMPQ